MSLAVPPNPAHLVTIKVRVNEVEHDDTAATATEVIDALDTLGYKDVEIIQTEEDLR